MTSKLDSSICLPSQSYYITDVFGDVDLNDDGLKDKIIAWTKIEMLDGDTIFYSVYSQKNNGTFSLSRTFSNLVPLFFKNYSTDRLTGIKKLDSIKIRYIKPEFAEVEFSNNNIGLSFYIEATILKKLFFKYSKKEQTWVLDREIQWFTPDQFDDDRTQEYDRSAITHLRIEDFNILKYTGW